MAWALDFGGFTERELGAAPPADGQTRPVEHHLSWALTDLKRAGRLENPRRSVWALREADDPPVAAPFGAARLAELRAMPYRQYLRTPEWRETRAAALVRAEHHCQWNAAHEGPLHVHHNSYDRLGEERVADLIVLCETCHERHHELDGRPRRDDAPPASVPPPFVASATPASPAPPPARRTLLRRLLPG